MAPSENQLIIERNYFGEQLIFLFNTSESEMEFDLSNFTNVKDFIFANEVVINHNGIKEIGKYDSSINRTSLKVKVKSDQFLIFLQH
jgi:hypothetical protein